MLLDSVTIYFFRGYAGFTLCQCFSINPLTNTIMTDSVLGESTIGAVESRGTGELGEVASLFWTVVASRAAGTQ